MDSPHPRKRPFPSKNKKRCELQNPLLVRRKTRKIGDIVMHKRRTWKALHGNPHTDLDPLWTLDSAESPVVDWVMVARPTEEERPARPSRWARLWRWTASWFEG